MNDFSSIENKRKEIRILADSVLKDYSNIDGLTSIIDSIFDLSNSKDFKKFLKIIGELEDAYDNGDYPIYNIPDNVIMDIPQIKYASDVFLPSKIHLLNLLAFFKIIQISDYNSLVRIIFLILSFNGEKISYEKVFGLSHKIMVLLYDFDRDIPFNPPSKDYFVKLKNLKWNKKAKKLLDKIFKIFQKFESTISQEINLEDPSTKYSDAYKILFLTAPSLIFLSGCSAVNNGRDIMDFDDVICACRTYFKLLDLINKD